MGMGIVIIVMIVIIVLLLVKNLRTKNAGWKMCSITRSLPWFKRNHSNQVPKHMEADDLQIQVPPKPMPAEDQIPEVPPKPMSAEDQIPEEIHRKTSSSHESTV
ncbi:uncharacterized protein LOC124127502 isoform X2 [Haliotis rufescens]|nr:uncharacterized protein LOC124127502 isoform X2 [Haliotis rufescens]